MHDEPRDRVRALLSELEEEALREGLDADELGDLLISEGETLVNDGSGT